MTRTDIMLEHIARVLGIGSEAGRRELDVLLRMYADAAELEQEDIDAEVCGCRNHAAAPEQPESVMHPFYAPAAAIPEADDDLYDDARCVEDPPELLPVLAVSPYTGAELSDDYPAFDDDPAPEAGTTSYSGFLLIRCSHCGDVHAFCARIATNEYRCQNCGGTTPLPDDLIPVYLRCECGKHWKYLTNRTEWGFDVNCLACGSPVPVEYRPGKNVYATIGTTAAPRRRKKPK